MFKFFKSLFLLIVGFWLLIILLTIGTAAMTNIMLSM